MLLREREARIRLGAELSGCEFIDATIYRHRIDAGKRSARQGLSIRSPWPPRPQYGLVNTRRSVGCRTQAWSSDMSLRTTPYVVRLPTHHTGAVSYTHLLKIAGWKDD